MDVNRLTGEKMIKLLIKIFDGETAKWVHLCYIPELLYETYKEQKPDNLKDMNTTISRWVKKDFDKDIEICNAASLEEVKSLIKAFCKETYPDVYLEQSTDRQGWLRVWISKKMKEDLEVGE